MRRALKKSVHWSRFFKNLVYVDGIPASITEEGLRVRFRRFGQVCCAVVHTFEDMHPDEATWGLVSFWNTGPRDKAISASDEEALSIEPVDMHEALGPKCPIRFKQVVHELQQRFTLAYIVREETLQRVAEKKRLLHLGGRRRRFLQLLQLLPPSWHCFHSHPAMCGLTRSLPFGLPPTERRKSRARLDAPLRPCYKVAAAAPTSPCRAASKSARQSWKHAATVYRTSANFAQLASCGGANISGVNSTAAAVVAGASPTKPSGSPRIARRDHGLDEGELTSAVDRSMESPPAVETVADATAAAAAADNPSTPRRRPEYRGGWQTPRQHTPAHWATEPRRHASPGDSRPLCCFPTLHSE